MLASATDSPKTQIAVFPMWLVMMLGLLLLALASWGPFGLRTTGLVEEWSYYRLFDAGQSFLRADFLMTQPNRVFVLLSYAIGYWLTPDSFVGLNIVHILWFLGKGLLFYAILRRLIPNNPLLAVVAALLFVIYPADTGLFEVRVASYHAAICFYLAAVYLLILYWQRPSLLTLAVMAAMQVLCLGTYETAFPLIAATPLVLVWLERRISRRVLRVAGVWYFISGMMAIWILSLIRSDSYQTILLQQSGTNTRLVRDMMFNFARAYYRSFIEGWLDAIQSINIGSAAIALAASLIIGLALWLSARSRPKNAQGASTTSDKHYLILIAAGLVILGLGFAPFLPFPQRSVNERVFLFSSIGAALSLGTVIFLISRLFRWQRTIFITASSALIGIAMLGALNQHQVVVDLSLTEQQLLAEIIKQVPQLKPGALLLVIDEKDRLYHTEMTFGANSTPVHFIDALRYLYGDPKMNAFLCYPQLDPWKTRSLNCAFKAEGIVILAQGKPIQTYPYEQVVIVRYNQWGNIAVANNVPDEYIDGPVSQAQTYDPSKLADPNASVPARVHTVFTAWPLGMPHVPHVAQESADIDFSLPVPGIGWDGPAGPVQWMVAKAATLNVLLLPTHDYAVRFRVTEWMTPDILNSLTLTVNHQPIALVSTTDGGARIFQGTIPQLVIASDPENTLLVLRINQLASRQDLGIANDPRLFGVRLQWLRIMPQ